MIELPILNSEGKQVDVLKIDETLLGGEIRHALLKQAYVVTHGNQRQGSARTKSRGSVQGSTRKLYKQKGTGSSRVGASRVPGRKGGGVAFAKTRTREDFRTDLTKKMRRLANRNALLAKLVDNEVKCFDSLAFAEPNTKTFAGMTRQVRLIPTFFIIADKAKGSALAPARKTEGVDVRRVEQLNVFDLLNHRFLIIDKASLASFIDESCYPVAEKTEA